MNEITWMKTVTRPLSPLKATTLFNGLDEGINRRIGTPLKKHLLEPVGIKHAWYVDSKEWKEFTLKISSLSKEDNFFINEIIFIKDLCDMLIKKSIEIKHTDVAKLTNNELLSIVDDYHEMMFYYPYIAWGLLVMDPILLGYFESSLKKYCKNNNKFNYLFTIFTTKIKNNHAENEYIDLMKLISRNGDLFEHMNNYCWLPMYDHNINPWTINDFKNRIIDIKDEQKEKMADLETQHIEKVQMFNTELRKIQNDDLKELILQIQEMLYLRTYRTDILRIVYFNVDTLFLEIQNRMGLKDRDFSYLSIDEIKDFLKRNNTIAEDSIINRKKHTLIIRINRYYDIYSTENDIDSLLEKNVGRIQLSKDIMGKGIYPGIVQGRTKLIESEKDYSIFQKGDIIVSSMTTPDMHSLIFKAAGIITDEGGVTCHAAIVSRELKIPCIIGTQISTKVFRNGDLIELNSKTGKIRRIE